MTIRYLLFSLFFCLCFASTEVAAQHVHASAPAPMCSELAPPLAEAATCTGAASCKACKNCKYCKHCSQKGKSCGVCKGTAATTATLQPARQEPVIADRPRRR